MLARWVSERVGASENELVNMARRGASLSMSDPDGFGVGTAMAPYLRAN
jgi:hypothetical protein